MREFLNEIVAWSKGQNRLVVARVTSTWGSSPRPVGSMMIINKDGKMAGSVSGGCVEGAVVKQALKLLDEGEVSSKIIFGVSDEEAWQVGLSCGGKIQVFLETVDFNNSPIWKTLKDSVSNNDSAVLISCLEEGKGTTSLVYNQEEIIGDPINETLRMEAEKVYNQRTHQTLEIGNQSYFIQVFPRKAQLLIIGVAHITVDLVTLGKMYGFETIVIDPRGYFVDHTSFNNPPDQLINSYPSEILHDFPLDAYTYCAILSHDTKIDDNALEILLHKDLGYLGALGSRKTHAKRTARLKEKGFDQDMINKVRAPIGVPIKA